MGHIEYFHAALDLGLPLLCSVTSDSYVRRKHEPLLPEEQRLVIIDSLRTITYTHLNRRTTEDVLRQLRPRYYVKGKDWEGRLPPEQVRICGRHGIGIVFLDTVRFSSTQILRRFQSR
jgi:bifunctional ADP-heptose synthase (sugar kinase/adenylyltransferase)